MANKPVDAAIAFVIGPVVDSAGDIVTSIAYNTASLEVKFFQETDTSSAAADITPTTSGNYDLTHLGHGYYLQEIAAADNDTVGTAWCTLIVPGTCLIAESQHVNIRSTAQGAAADRLVDILEDNDTMPSDLQTWLGTAPLALESQLVQSSTELVDSTAQAAIADAVWDEAIAGHVSAGSFGEEVQAHATSSEVTTVGNAVTTVDNVVDAIKVTTDKLDDTLEDDSGTYRFTENSLEEAPTGAGSGATAQEVWEYATRGLTEDVDLAADQSGVTVGTVTNVTTVATVTALAAGAYTAIADAILKRDLSAVTGEASRSVLNAIRAIRNRVNLNRTGGTFTVYKEDDVTEAWTAGVTTESGAAGLAEIDPA